MEKLHGVTVAMVTPIDDQNKIKEGALRQLVNFLIEKDVDCLYPGGTTGEMYRLSLAERKQLAQIVVEEADNRLPVYIHVGAMRMDDTLELARHANKISASGIGVVTPSYFNVNQREMTEYYLSISRAVPDDFPIYLYNIPQCSGNDLKVDTIKEILKNAKNIVGIKYSYPDMMTTEKYIGISEEFSVLHGTDALFHSLLTMGCDGVVSGIAGVYPEPFVEVKKAYEKRNMERAREMQKLANEYRSLLKAGSNMAYFKEGLKYRGIDVGHMRRPQLDLTETEKNNLIKNLDKLAEKSSIIK